MNNRNVSARATPGSKMSPKLTVNQTADKEGFASDALPILQAVDARTEIINSRMECASKICIFRGVF